MPRSSGCSAPRAASWRTGPGLWPRCAGRQSSLRRLGAAYEMWPPAYPRLAPVPIAMPSSYPTRRDVLKATGLALAGSALGAPAVGAHKSVIVAGGGIAGLCCAFELMERGHEVTLLEAS